MENYNIIDYSTPNTITGRQIDSSFNTNTFIVKSGAIKSLTTDALLILLSKSNNISQEKRERAQKIVDTQTDIDFLEIELKNKRKLFADLEKQF